MGGNTYIVWGEITLIKSVTGIILPLLKSAPKLSKKLNPSMNSFYMSLQTEKCYKINFIFDRVSDQKVDLHFAL